MASETQTLEIKVPKNVAWIKRQGVQSIIGRSIVFTIAAVGAIMYFVPFLWAVSTSLKPQEQLFKFPPEWIPKPLQFRNYVEALTRLPFGRFFINTVILTLAPMAGDILINILVAYGFARLEFPGRDVLFMVLLGTMMLPAQVTMIPVFIIFRSLGWINTYYPLILPSYFGSAFYIFLLRQFFRTIPVDLEHAAEIDGASRLQILFRVIAPLSGPAIATVAVFSFMAHWQEFFGPLIYLNSTKLIPLSLGLQRFREDYGGTVWHHLMAASVVSTLPPLLLFFLAQRYFISGIVMTGMKE